MKDRSIIITMRRAEPKERFTWNAAEGEGEVLKTMSRIIQPLGSIVRQILIEMDAKGVTNVRAINRELITQKEIPMGPLELVAILAQLVSSTLQVLNKPPRKEKSDGQETKNNHD